MDPGLVLFHKQFGFADGGAADKLLVVLGKSDSHLVIVKTTSKGARYRNDHGCQAGNRFPAFLLTQGCCFLKKNTWVCLTEFYDVSLQQLYDRMLKGDAHKIGLLDKVLTRDLQVCAAGCDDIPKAQEDLVRASFV